MTSDRRAGRRTLPMRASLTYPTGGSGRHANLRVEDATSGITIIDLELNADEFLTFMSNGQAHGISATPSAETLAQVGRQYNTETLSVPDELRHLGRDTTDAHREYAAGFLTDGWAGYRWNRTNRGWSLMRYRYDDVTHDA